MPKKEYREAWELKHGRKYPREWHPESKESNLRRLNRSRERRRNQVRDLKNKPCMDCGGTFDPVCMDFDHRPGEVKSFIISSAMGRSPTWDRVLEEIAKCDLVCSNCHRVRTYRQRNHGDLVVNGLRKDEEDEASVPELRNGPLFDK